MMKEMTYAPATVACFPVFCCLRDNFLGRCGTQRHRLCSVWRHSLLVLGIGRQGDVLQDLATEVGFDMAMADCLGTPRTRPPAIIPLARGGVG